jgi:arsenical pump membrane protein
MVAHSILSSAEQAWPPFVLVVGLLLIGAAAADEGLFEALGARLARTGLGPRSLLLALLALVAAVTAVLNLDTSAVFLTPVLIHAARRRGLDERPFVYGSVFMANSASLLLPGSNLTNLLVLRNEPESGFGFAARMVPAWIAACTVTALFLVVTFRLEADRREDRDVPPLRPGPGGAAAITAAVLVVVLPDPALPVLALGVAAAGARRLRPRLDHRTLALLFALTVALGALARRWDGPADLLAGGGAWAAAGIGASASVLVNNLPAAVVLSAHPTAHPAALLVGLDLGPNLAVTGSLSAVLWLQTARSLEAPTSIATYSRLGLLLVPATLSVALVALLVTP